MKALTQLYKTHPSVALVVNCLGFFVWAATMIVMMVILAVAFTG